MIAPFVKPKQLTFVCVAVTVIAGGWVKTTAAVWEHAGKELSVTLTVYVPAPIAERVAVVCPEGVHE